MADQAEYDSLVNQRKNARARRDACQRRINEYDYLLGRLRPAKESIADLKKDFKKNKKADEKLYDKKHDWEGSTYNSFKSKMGTLMSENESYYKYSLDHVLDSLNNEITRIENLRLKEYGLLGEIGSWINSLSNKIENFWN